MAYPYRNNKQDRYPQGYLPKIQYWAGVLAKAIEAGEDHTTIGMAKSKLDYFYNREVDRIQKEF